VKFYLLCDKLTSQSCLEPETRLGVRAWAGRATGGWAGAEQGLWGTVLRGRLGAEGKDRGRC